NILHANNPLLSYPLGETLFDTTQGAKLCFAYEDGTLTTHPLWPWPMNDRIRDALIQSGRAAVDVTARVQEIFGPIPTQCIAPQASAKPSLTLPVAGRVGGWITDLEIANPGDRATEAMLTFAPGAACRRSPGRSSCADTKVSP